MKLKTYKIINRGISFELSEEKYNRIRKSDCKAAAQLKRTMNGNNTDIHISRNLSCTTNILEYLNGEKLHMPRDVCPNKFKEELDYWGVTEDKLEACCYTKYVSFFEDIEIFKILEGYIERGKTTRAKVDSLCRGTGCWRSLRARIWTVLDYPTSSILAKIYLYVSNFLVLLSLFLLVARTHPVFQRSLTEEEWRDFFTDEEETIYLHDEYSSENDTYAQIPFPDNVIVTFEFLNYFEYITMSYFTLELMIKLFSFPLPWKKFVSFINVIDILSLIVMYTTLIANINDQKEKYTDSFHDALHSLQLIRVFRLFRLVKNVKGFRIIVFTVRASLFDLLLLLLCLFSAVLLFSSLAYFSQDPAFESIPQAFWWSIITMTTVGYGDISPTTIQGQLIGSACAVGGLCLLAILIPIFVNNFMLFYFHSTALERKEKIKTENTLNKVSPVLTVKEKV